MAAAAGYKTITLVGREKTGTYGQATATSFYALPLESGSPVREKELVKDGTLVGTGGYSQAVTTKLSATASLSFFFTYTGLEVLLLCALGHQQIHSVRALGNGFYEHILEPGDELATEFWATNEGWTTADGLTTNAVKSRRLTVIQDKVVSRHKLISAYVNKLTVSGSAGELVKGSVELLGYDVVRESAPLPVHNESPEDYVNFPDVVFAVNGKQYAISGFELSLDNKLAQTQANRLNPEEPTRAGFREARLKVSLPAYAYDDFYALYESGDEVRAELLFVKGDGHEVSFVFPRALVTSATAQVGGEGVVPQDVEFVALESLSPEVPSGRNVEMYVRLVNQLPEEVWNL